jgi:hypothetical protein
MSQVLVHFRPDHGEIAQGDCGLFASRAAVANQGAISIFPKNSGNAGGLKSMARKFSYISHMAETE